METATLPIINSNNNKKVFQINKTQQNINRNNDVVIIKVNIGSDEDENENDDNDDDDGIDSSTTTFLALKSSENRNNHLQKQQKIVTPEYITCKICLNTFVSCSNQVHRIESCECKFCVSCLKQYVKQSIDNFDVCPINCPDSKCKTKGSLTRQEVKCLIFNITRFPSSSKIFASKTLDHNNNINKNYEENSEEATEKSALVVDGELSSQLNIELELELLNQRLYEQYLNVYENSDILRDPTRVHCPRPDCNNVCKVNIIIDPQIKKNVQKSYKVICDKCNFVFCSVCFKTWTNDDNNNNEDKETSKNSKNNKKTSCKYFKMKRKKNVINHLYHHYYHHPYSLNNEETTECNCHCTAPTNKNKKTKTSTTSTTSSYYNNIDSEANYYSSYQKSKSNSKKKTKIKAKTKIISLSSNSKNSENMMKTSVSSTTSTTSSSSSSSSSLSVSTTSSSIVSSASTGGGVGKESSKVVETAAVVVNLENIKRCPKCSILIERADGCAQIMCKACRHTFCFYCLASLDDDFMLKHFTKSGPCKGRLGHSRFSLLVHRAGVVAIFCGTALLVLLVSPLILVSLPCLVFSSKCRKSCLNMLPKFNDTSDTDNITNTSTTTT